MEEICVWDICVREGNYEKMLWQQRLLKVTVKPKPYGLMVDTALKNEVFH